MQTTDQPASRPASDVGSEGADALPELSVVIPVYNNRDTLPELLERLARTLEHESYELVLVVDGSPDDSLAYLREQARSRSELVVVELARNFGQHAALCAGFEVARGHVALILDADLQQRPEDLPAFVARWRDGFDFVSGWRVARRDPWFRRLGSIAMNLLVRSITRVHLHDWGCPIAAVDRSILDRIPACGEQRRFLKPLVALLARRVSELRVEGQERVGESSYSILTLVGVALDFAVSFSSRPFQKLAGFGLLLFGGGIFGGLSYFVLRFAGMGDSPPFQGAVIMALLLGILILILGAQGEFTHRIYRMVQGSPLFEVRAVHSHPARRA